MEEKITVCLPVYNGSETIKETIYSILSQSFSYFELVIVDNCSTDNTVSIIRKINDRRIKIYLNKKNLGCGGNLNACLKRAKGDILFFISDDDIAEIHALEKVYQAFQKDYNIGIVVRPYFWFYNNKNIPVRITTQFIEEKIVSINDSFNNIKDVISLSDQISGIGIRKKYLTKNFGIQPFIEMATVVTDILKSHKALILKDNIVGVRISKSGSMNPIIYKNSPMMVWYNLIVNTFHEKKYNALVRYLISNFIANNYIGLVQIKNYGGMKSLIKEIYYLLKLKKNNIFSLKFWIYAIITIFTPAFILRKLVIYYKNKVNAKLIKNINLE